MASVGLGQSKGERLYLPDLNGSIYALPEVGFKAYVERFVSPLSVASYCDLMVYAPQMLK